MSFGAPASEDRQPANFTFTADNLALAKRIISRYPPGKQQSAVMPLLDLAQRQNGNWLPRAAMDYVADLLGMPRIRVYEVASFYTMYNKAPVGKFLIWVCTTTPCWLCGSEDVKRAIKDKLGVSPGHTTPDGLFTVVEAECLGACVNAPMVQVNDDYYEDLNYERMVAVIEALKRGERPPIGSQTGRHGSEAASGATTLLTLVPKSGETKPAEAEPAEPVPPAETTAAASEAVPVETAAPAEAIAAKPAETAQSADAAKPVVAKPAGAKSAATKKGAKVKE